MKKNNTANAARLTNKPARDLQQMILRTHPSSCRAKALKEAATTNSIAA